MTMRSSHALVILTATCACTLPAMSAMAQSPEDRAAADLLYNEGVKAVIAGDYAAAVIHFQRGYARDKDPKFLYNTAICYGRLGNWDKAIEFTTKTLADDLAPSNLRVQAQARLQAYRAAGGATAQLTTLASGDQSGDVRLIRTPERQPSRGLSGLGWAGAGIAILGMSLTTAAIVTSINLGGDIDAYTEDASTNPDLSRDTERYDDLTSRQRTGQILLYAGAGALAAGATLLLIDLLGGAESEPDAPAARSSWQPVINVSPDAPYAGVRLTF